MLNWAALLLASSIVAGPGPEARGQATGDEGLAVFERVVRPVLHGTCARCHGAKKASGGLRLDSRAALLEGGDSGPAVVPSDPGQSLLIQAIRHEDGLAMPPKQPKLSGETIAAFVKWVELGAPDPRTGEARAVGSTWPEEVRRHWAFQPVRKVTPANVTHREWMRNPVDAFILGKLEDRNWRPAPPPSRAEWLRRASFDLIGLPPTPEEVEAFEADSSRDAYERVVDRLLASPHYGERWGQHWLDVVRYAETEGYEYDRHLPDAWRYRDYVINALNRDKPFDRFLVQQLAGDEIEPNEPENLAAAVFHRLGPVRRNAGNPEIALSRNEVLTERTDIIGTAFLGLTVGCARCHDHKLEPITQKDYYRLQAYFAASEEHNIILAPDADRKAWETETGRIKGAMQYLQKRAKRAVGAERERLLAGVEALEDRMPPPLPTIPSTHNAFETRTAIHVLKRGIWENKGDAVGPRPPSILVADDQPELRADLSHPRTELARWLVQPDHPLTARVLVNRLWQYHFGAGLVKTVNDFGTKGSPPSHPELLDWLTAKFVAGGWRLKPLHRLIMASETYRQSSRSALSGEAERTDPEDRLLWRFPRRRLEAEEVRDAMLAVAGRLNPKAGGPSVTVPVDPNLVTLLYKTSQWQVTADPAAFDRRSVYLIAKRNLRLPFFETFDAPALLTSCARRESTTHAPQALELLNGSLSNELAEAFAARLEAETGSSPDIVVGRAFLLALGRPPTSEERELSLAFVRTQPLKEFALALFNLRGSLRLRCLGRRPRQPPMGRPQRHRGEPYSSCRRDRQARGRIAQGPEAPGPAGRDARPLGR
jgi:mono/diheme cytochrome c family protein